MSTDRSTLSHILIVEPQFSGHHAIYLRRIVAGYLERGHRVTVAVRNADRWDEYVGLARVAGLLSVEELAPAKNWFAVLGQASRELSHWVTFREVFRRVNRASRVDLVMLPYADYCLYAIGLLGSPFGNVPWEGICMRPSFHFTQMGINAPRPSMSRVKETLFGRLLTSKYLRRMFTIDPVLRTYYAARPMLASRLTYIPDPSEFYVTTDAAAARACLGIPSDALVVLVYGVIDRRKGLADLLRGVLDCPVGANVHVLIAGVQESETVKECAPHLDHLMTQGKLHSVNRLVDSRTEELVFAASDIVWVGYHGHYGMSGVLVMAGRAAKPTISSDMGLIGYLTQRNRSGIVVKTADPKGVAAAITRLGDPTVRANLAQAGVDSAKTHDTVFFVNQLCEFKA